VWCLGFVVGLVVVCVVVLVLLVSLVLLLSFVFLEVLVMVGSAVYVCVCCGKFGWVMVVE
jgi:hypothetical protein